MKSDNIRHMVHGFYIDYTLERQHSIYSGLNQMHPYVNITHFFPLFGVRARKCKIMHRAAIVFPLGGLLENIQNSAMPTPSSGWK